MLTSETSMDNDSVDQILNGSFDFHVYSSPDPYSVRRMDGLDTARLAYEVEMSGFVLNSDYYSTCICSLLTFKEFYNQHYLYHPNEPLICS